MSLLLRVLLLCLSVPVLAAPEAKNVHEYALDNGLKILVKEDHRSPVVVSQVWYKVGSSYEPGGLTGISHLLEHMMFKGTETHPPGEFSRIIAANGGRENAFTGQDYTAYFQSLEKSRLEVSFELEADRMRNLRLLPDEFAKELQVVLEERRMRTDDDPRSKTYEHFNATAFTNSPYENPIIGWPSDIESLTVADLRAWYARWYAPNNATVVVVGDVDPDAVYRLAKRHFGPLAPSELDGIKPRREVDQLGLRRMAVKLPAKLPYVVMGYKVPVLNAVEEPWEAYALEVLAGILDGGNSARLETRLVRGKQIAVSAGAGYQFYDRLPTLFLLDGTPAKGTEPAELEEALREEIRMLREIPVTDEELERVKAQVLANQTYEQDSPFYQAMQLGTLETVGLGWKKMDEYVDRINAVTAQQVQQVAQKYLVEERLTIAHLEPLPIENNKAGATATTGGRHVR